MNQRRPQHPRPRTAQKGRKGPFLWVVLALGLLALLVLPWAIVRLGSTNEVAPEAQSAASQGPLQVGALELSQTSVDLGRVALGQWVRPTFRLRNVGDSPVTVTVDERNISTLEGC